MTGIGGSISAHFLAHLCHNTDWDIVGEYELKRIFVFKNKRAMNVFLAKIRHTLGEWRVEIAGPDGFFEKRAV